MTTFKASRSSGRTTPDLTVIENEGYHVIAPKGLTRICRGSKLVCTSDVKAAMYALKDSSATAEKLFFQLIIFHKTFLLAEDPNSSKIRKRIEPLFVTVHPDSNRGAVRFCRGEEGIHFSFFVPSLVSFTCRKVSVIFRSLTVPLRLVYWLLLQVMFAAMRMPVALAISTVGDASGGFRAG